MDRKEKRMRIAKEDILRSLVESGTGLRSSILKEDIKNSDLFEDSLRELEKEGHIKIKDGIIDVTKTGREKGKDILHRHIILEDYFTKSKGRKKAHEIAHLVEHYISKEIEDNIKMIEGLKGRSVPITKIKRGIITDMDLDMNLFERVVSMGIVPGEKLRITNILPNVIIVEINNKKFALDREIAKKIKSIET